MSVVPFLALRIAGTMFMYGFRYFFIFFYCQESRMTTPIKRKLKRNSFYDKTLTSFNYIKKFLINEVGTELDSDVYRLVLMGRSKRS